MSAEPIALLVHGAWHGAWCWASIQAELDRRGVPSIAIDLPGHGASLLPLGDLYGDAAHTAAVIDRLARPVVLVGHSYGGAVITEAASQTEWVRSLVYLAAFAPLPGESVMGLATSTDEEVALSQAMRPREDGVFELDPVGIVAALYGSCPSAAAAAAASRVDLHPIVAFTQPVTGDPRTSVPSTYVVCARDEAVAPGLQRSMATRCTSAVELDTDHSPFLSAVPETADVIERAVRAAR